MEIASVIILFSQLYSHKYMSYICFSSFQFLLLFLLTFFFILHTDHNFPSLLPTSKWLVFIKCYGLVVLKL